MKKLNLLLFCFSLFFLACSDNTASEAEAKEEVKKEENMTKPESAVKIAPFGATQAYPEAKMASMEYQGGMFKFGVENYELKAQTPDAGDLMCANSDKGQHIHLIIDNKPYAAKYDAEFEYEVEDGEHVVLAFLGRSYHESIKTPQAGMVKRITVEGGNTTNATDVTEPMLFYSRPKGTYVGKKNTDKILLDFYPYNVELGESYGVKVTVNETEVAVVDTWQPYALTGLPMGDNRVTLTLVDAEGKAVDTPLNPVTRTFTLKPDPADTATEG